MVTAFVLLLVGAYLLGSVPMAYLIAKWRRGIDLREYGSGNVGAANVMAAVSKRWTIPVIIFDIGKGALVVWVAQLLELSAAQWAAVGFAAIVGHNWPIFLGLRGGRGIYTTLGVITMLNPWLGLITLVVPYLFAPFRQVSFGVFVVFILTPLLSWFASEPLGVAGRLPITLGIIALMLLAIARRLIQPRTALSAKTGAMELLCNRMLFDRDIRDRETWVGQTRKAGSETNQQV